CIRLWGVTRSTLAARGFVDLSNKPMITCTLVYRMATVVPVRRVSFYCSTLSTAVSKRTIAPSETRGLAASCVNAPSVT
ncbi:hypothetical protein PFISCL1PPCAC_20797, partial [Pristionchus fissidentatus]